MGYPFKTTPLNDSLTALNQLTIEEASCYRVICDNEATHNEQEVARKQLLSISEKKNQIKSKASLVPRDFDAYQGALETTIKKFIEENPKPSPPTPCLHLESEKRLRTLNNGMTQVVTQCLLCGSPFQDHKKINITNWQELPSFDSGIKRQESVLYSEWHEQYKDTIESIIGEDCRKVDFNDDEFYKNYEKVEPAPFTSDDCKHENVILTIRAYSETNRPVIEQCVTCGHHIKAVPKKSISNWESLPLFDEELKPRQFEISKAWRGARTIAREKAFLEHRQNIKEKISNGELIIEDKSTFGTYYNSIEWRRTRQRIFDRDNYECQSCSKNAQCVHHITYDRLGCENDLDLISLCNNCHDEVHRRQNLFGISYRLTPNDIKTLSEWQFAEEDS